MPASHGRSRWRVAFFWWVVTCLQIATSTHGIVAVNNLVLYPLLACYMGWFFKRWCARTTVAIAIAVSGIGLTVNSHVGSLWITWINLLIVSIFSLEATAHLRRVSTRRIETDPLTGIHNRAGYYRTAAAALTAAHRTRVDLTLVLIDIDHFKQVNDTRGHAAGDHALIALAAAARAAVRTTDDIARIGGDEFVIVLPDMSTADAHTLIERIRSRTAIDFSYGIAHSTPSDSTDALLARADTELYRHKQNRPDPDPV